MLHDRGVLRAPAEAHRPLVELLYFEGCPNQAGAQALVERVSDEVDGHVEIKLVEVTGPDAAARKRFLGSPSIRVDGRDIEPGADARTDYTFSCRIYRTQHGTSGQPDERWLRDALRNSHPTLPNAAA